MPKSFAHRSKDPYRNLAKEYGYYSRASFKLEQIDNRFRLIKGSRTILDIGASPGGWSQIILKRTSPTARLVAIDIQRIRKIKDARFHFIKGDIMSLDWKNKESFMEFTPYDLVVCDISPKITGVWDMDQYRQIELAREASKIVEQFGSPTVKFVCKIFEGRDARVFRKDITRVFRKVNYHKPKASRPESAETYLIARGLNDRFESSIIKDS